MRRFGLVVLAALAAAVSAAPAAGAPASREAALESYLSLMDRTRVPVGWTGDAGSCVTGTESPASVTATLDAVNLLRDFAGVGPVSFDPARNQKALEAAVMMRAANNLDHYPGTDWPCYTDAGAEGAARSNLFLGETGAGAMIGYVDDEGVSSLGHRRWLLDPRATIFGTGSTDATNALFVVGEDADPAGVIPEIVAWPPAGHTPWPLVFADWSASLSVPGFVDASNATIAVTFDGRPMPVSDVADHGQGMGSGHMLSWRVAFDESEREMPRSAEVVVGGVLVDGVPREFRYPIELVPVLPPAPGAFTAVRRGPKLTVDWQAAAERGVPVTGYRVVGDDGGTESEFDVTTGPTARTLDVDYDQPNRVVRVRVVPLSRAGSPEVTAISVMPGSAGDPAPGSDGRAAPRLRARRVRLSGRRLRFVVRLDRRATGRVRAVARAPGGRARRTAAVRDGRARFRMRLSRRLAGGRPLILRISYGGDARVAPGRIRLRFS